MVAFDLGKTDKIWGVSDAYFRRSAVGSVQFT